MTKRRNREPQYTAIFHSVSGCYESTPASYQGIFRVAMRDRGVIAIVEKHVHHPCGWKSEWKDRIRWQAPGKDVMIIQSLDDLTGNIELVRILSSCKVKDQIVTELSVATWSSVQHRFTCSPRDGWRCTRRCCLCDWGIALKDDEVRGVGGYVICRKCESQFKLSKITAKAGSLERKWKRYLKAVDA